MSSKTSSGPTKQSFEILGMSYCCRMIWNIPFETFKKGFNVSENIKTLEQSLLHGVKGVKDFEFYLELIIKNMSDSKYMYSLEVSSQTLPGHLLPDIDYAFVDLGGEIYVLNPFNHQSSRPLLTKILKTKEKEGILKEGDILSVHCIMVQGGEADFSLRQRVVDSQNVTTVDCEFVPLTTATGSDLGAYYLNSYMPPSSVDAAIFFLEDPEEIDKSELRPLISNYLTEKLSKQNVVRILRVAVKNGLKDLQCKAIAFIKTYGCNESV